jgi:NDP-sugar pyrophosphorylase family protein
VNVHHYADQIEEAVLNADGWGSKITFSDERTEVLETGGGLVKAAPHLLHDDFVVLNVDVLTDLDLKSMIQQHRSNGAVATLAVSDRKTSRYFLFDSNNQLCGWRNVSTGEEKLPRPAAEYIQKAFSGVHVINPALFGFIHRTGKFSMVDVYLDICASQKIDSYDHTGSRFIDVGKPDSATEAAKLFL